MLRKFQRIDYMMLGVLVCFLVLSTLAISSATSGTRLDGFDRNHIIMFTVFFLPLILISLVDYRILNDYMTYAMYGIGIVLLVLVELIGSTYNNSKRWLEIGSQQFQPSELVKIVLVIMLARVLSKRDGEFLSTRHILLSTAIVIVPVLFVLRQPDLATSIIFFVILVGMLWIAKMRMKHILIAFAGFMGFVVILVSLYFVSIDTFHKIIKPYQMERIQTFINPDSAPDEDKWHVRNSIEAISTGGLVGKGHKQGEYIQSRFIPYDYADSIFVVIGEELGFVGSSILLLLYFFLIYRMILVALNCDDYFGKYIVIGIVSMFTLQIFQNVAMHLGLMPLTGIALPFISYGGSSLLVNMISVGVVMSIKVHSEQKSVMD